MRLILLVQVGELSDEITVNKILSAYWTRGPEIWRQTNGRIDAFVSGAGTGGTIAGISVYLKGLQPDLRVVLADPEGSGLYNKVRLCSQQTFMSLTYRRSKKGLCMIQENPKDGVEGIKSTLWLKECKYLLPAT